MKGIPISIIHLGLFILTGFSMVIIFSKTAVTGVASSNKIIELFRYKHNNSLSCQYIKISELNTKPQSVSAELSCEQKSCLITVNDNGSTHSFSPVNHDGIKQIDVKDFFYDSQRRIVGFTTSTPDLSSRIIMDFDGELIQSIDETPGENRQLHLLGFQPETGMLVYSDQKSQDTYYYSTDSVYFARRRCP